MHELSIAMSIVDAALDEARQRNAKVNAVHLRLGALSGVVKDALLFSYEVACQDTALQGSQLIVEDLPVVIFCPQCQQQQILASVQSFCCPRCGMPSMDVRQGKELEVVALEIEALEIEAREVEAPEIETPEVKAREIKARETEKEARKGA